MASVVEVQEQVQEREQELVREQELEQVQEQEFEPVAAAAAVVPVQEQVLDFV